MAILMEQTISKVTYNGVEIPLKGAEKEVWVLKDSVDTSKKFSTPIAFSSNGKDFSSIEVGGSSTPGPSGMVYSLKYGSQTVAPSGIFGPNRVMYRKVVFAASPSGDLLTWLQANAVKQVSDIALQESKSITIKTTDNGTSTVTPDQPYDGIKNVVLNVDPGTVVTTLTINGSGSSYDTGLGVLYQTENGAMLFSGDHSTKSTFKVTNVLIGGLVFLFSSPVEVPKFTFKEAYSSNVTQIGVSDMDNPNYIDPVLVCRVTNNNPTIAFFAYTQE